MEESTETVIRAIVVRNLNSSNKELNQSIKKIVELNIAKISGLTANITVEPIKTFSGQSIAVLASTQLGDPFYSISENKKGSTVIQTAFDQWAELFNEVGESGFIDSTLNVLFYKAVITTTRSNNGRPGFWIHNISEPLDAWLVENMHFVEFTYKDYGEYEIHFRGAVSRNANVLKMVNAELAKTLGSE
jgi:hypothetical protein